MSATLAGEKRRWAIAAGGAVLVMAAFVFLVRLPPPVAVLPAPVVQPTAPTARPAVQLAKPTRSDAILSETMELRDMRPLFLPTERNATLPEPKLEPGRTFLDNDTFKLSFTDAELNIGKGLPAVVTLDGKPVSKARPADVLAPDVIPLTLHGFGRNDPAVKPLEPRGGIVEVMAVETGHRVWVAEVEIAAAPPGAKAWAPIEFVAAVDAAGLVSPLVVTESSQVEEVDAYFRKYLARTLRIGERLRPGFYRIVVAP